MSIGIVLVVVAAVVVVGFAAGVAVDRRRRSRLRDRFGPEYGRAVEATGSRRAAEQELEARESRFADLEIKPVPGEVREQYARRWMRVQEEFVDRPEAAIHDADELVAALMRDRGYPDEGHEQRLRDLSVRHGRALEYYRAALEVHAMSTHNAATTEQLRGAMMHYRTLFDDLLADGEPTGTRRS
ncbi:MULTISPECIES: hypothetical protein [Streptomyces]|uniref:Secreted protein n=1 Tax=Streptomyces viridochromogenes TaxID=1938 RepID=A0A0L8LCH1_STRVR|nr:MULTISPECIES: hypothetical protein [Streptomyces]KOG35837.1 hypothetical protein ADK34_04280 [Streptomyces viridochromogenes]